MQTNVKATPVKFLECVRLLGFYENKSVWRWWLESDGERYLDWKKNDLFYVLMFPVCGLLYGHVICIWSFNLI